MKHIILFLLATISLSAHFDERIYVNYHDLQLTHHGIFLQVEEDQWILIKELHHDHRGYYLTESLLSSFIASCTECGNIYVNYIPSECNQCGSQSFDIDYTSYWDRKSRKK